MISNFNRENNSNVNETKCFEFEKCWHHTCLTARHANKNMNKRREDHAIREPKGRALYPCLPHLPMDRENAGPGPEWWLLHALGHVSPGIAPRRSPQVLSPACQVSI